MIDDDDDDGCMGVKYYSQVFYLNLLFQFFLIEN